MMRLFLSILALSITISSFGQRNKKEEEPVVQTFIEGITYTLPRTGIKISVNSSKEVFEPGPYAQYAEQLLGIKDAKTKRSVKWSILNIRFNTFSEPDPEQVRKAMGKTAALIGLTSEGCIAGINAAIEQKTEKQIQTNNFNAGLTLNDGFSFSRFNETPYIVQGDSTNGYKTFKVTIEQKAVEAAKKIYDCRVNMYDMSVGRMDESHPDGEAYKASLELLKATEKNYLSLFTGRTTYEDQVSGFEFVPTSTKGEVVFRFSEEKGIVSASDLSVKPVIIEIVPEKSLIDKYNSLVSSTNPNAGISGIYYRMPAIVNLNLIQDLKVIATSRISMAQFGVVAPMPEEYLSGGYSILFHTETGTIKSIIKK